MEHIDLGLKDGTLKDVDEVRGLVTRTAYIRDLVEVDIEFKRGEDRVKVNAALEKHVNTQNENKNELLS